MDLEKLRIEAEAYQGPELDGLEALQSAESTRQGYEAEIAQEMSHIKDFAISLITGSQHISSHDPNIASSSAILVKRTGPSRGIYIVALGRHGSTIDPIQFRAFQGLPLSQRLTRTGSAIPGSWVGRNVGGEPCYGVPLGEPEHLDLPLTIIQSPVVTQEALVESKTRAESALQMRKKTVSMIVEALRNAEYNPQAETTFADAIAIAEDNGLVEAK